MASLAIEKKATNYGTSITGQTYQPSPKALPSTARKPIIKRSNSLPASNKLVNSGSRTANSTPLGAKKYPGTAKKATTGGGDRARSTVGIATTGATKSIGSVTSGVVGAGVKAPNGAPSAYKSPLSTSTPNKTLPKPYPGANSLPKPNGYPQSSSGGVKTAVKPGAPKPFVPPVEQQKRAADSKPKPYPGTNTLPGHASTTPVTAQKLKPLPRLGPQVGAGQKMQHISV